VKDPYKPIFPFKGHPTYGYPSLRAAVKGLMLEGKTPMEFAGNEFGGAKVRAMLNAIEYGGVV